jgi:hypothetical protein
MRMPQRSARPHAKTIRPAEAYLSAGAEEARRLQLRLGEQPADGGCRHAEAQFGQFAADPPMAPTRILPREPQHQLPNLGRQLRPPAPAFRLAPLPANERLMPTQKGPRSHQKHAARRARQAASCGRQQGPINRPELRPNDLPPQDLKLMAQHQQFDVFHMQATTATHKRPEYSPHGEVEEREGHAADHPNPRPTERRHEYWRPSGDRCRAAGRVADLDRQERRRCRQVQLGDGLHRRRGGGRRARVSSPGSGRPDTTRLPIHRELSADHWNGKEHWHGTEGSTVRVRQRALKHLQAHHARQRMSRRAPFFTTSLTGWMTTDLPVKSGIVD